MTKKRLSKPSRIRKVVKRMPKNPQVSNIEKYVSAWKLQNVDFRRANNLPTRAKMVT